MPSPLLRVVRMTFHPAKLDVFAAIFREAQPKIEAVHGCRSVELWRDARFPNVLSTVSLWDGPESLQAYRDSDLFKTTWARTTKLFAAAPEAWSHLPADL